jgi:hypothetical protein
MLLSYQAKEKKSRLSFYLHCINDVVDQCIGYYTVRRINRRWPMIVFYNMIDIVAINAMTIWLCQNSEWNMRKTNTRRIFLTQLSKVLTDSQNQRRGQDSRLMPKVKLALLSLGYNLHSESLQDLTVSTPPNPAKRRCYMCPTKPGRKVRQTCSHCGQNVCLSHSNSITMVTCQKCK